MHILLSFSIIEEGGYNSSLSPISGTNTTLTAIPKGRVIKEYKVKDLSNIEGVKSFLNNNSPVE